MAQRKLAGTVHFGGVVYPAGSVPPSEVAEKITNPKAWAPEPESTKDEPVKAPAPPERDPAPARAPRGKRT